MSDFDIVACATCGEKAGVLEKPSDKEQHMVGAYPIALCAEGHISWLYADGWRNYLNEQDWIEAEEAAR